MLSRTADNLFWMARYLERAESTARLLTMGQRMAVLPGSAYRDEWRSVLRVTGCESFLKGTGPVTEADVVAILLLDPENAASIQACLVRARANGRSVRTKLTQDMWEALNMSWRHFEGCTVAEAVQELPVLIDWVKTRTAVFKGAMETGLMRHAGHDFIRIGGAIERAQMTLRLLDVKYYVLLPETDVVGGGRDHYQWTSVLHALSGSRAYHHVYGGVHTPAQIVDFLMVNRTFPRSVAFCVDQMRTHLARLAKEHGTRSACHDTTDELFALLKAGRNGVFIERGLHESVQHCLLLTNRLATEIADSYHF
ncbi:MAG: alpha-E domain-containing protein [Holophagaceae bacterium]|nr:alpha-E domain-containing protein [Holophagaceae bacterium]